jgi:hypothetical protein
MSNVPASLALNLRHGVPSIRDERIVLWHAVLGSQFSVLSSRLSALGSWFSVLSSQFSVLGSWFSVLGSRFSVLFKPKEDAQYYLAVYMTAG